MIRYCHTSKILEGCGEQANAAKRGLTLKAPVPCRIYDHPRQEVAFR